jgi:nucleoid-associated protein YgaU
MGFFDFTSDSEEEEILSDTNNTVVSSADIEDIESNFEGLSIDRFRVEVDGDTIYLSGVAKDFDTREEAILIAGNLDGIAEINADNLITSDLVDVDIDIEDEYEESTIDIPEEIFYTIEKGDSLWGIATKFYNDGSKYPYIVDANREIIKDENLIYEGQTIRIPEIVV